MISGFTIVRNAILLDYPLRECIYSLLSFCDEVVINVGESDDDTESLCDEIEQEAPKQVRLLHSRWDSANQSGGYQLKQQTDLALSGCQGDWCFYLQADEVLHEEDVPRILNTMGKASRREQVDGILFDYLHFYSNFDYVITGRNWYRREVRAFKNHRGIHAFRDAQGFRKEGRRLRVIKSGGRVFHYGHVRTVESLKTKAVQMAQWWGEVPNAVPSAFQPRRHVGLRRFTGTHPQVMNQRLAAGDAYIDPMTCPR